MRSSLWKTVVNDLKGTRVKGDSSESQTREESQGHLIMYVGEKLMPLSALSASTAVESEMVPESTRSVLDPRPSSAVVRLPVGPVLDQTFISLAKREGVVLSLGIDSFTARLINLLDDSNRDTLGDLEAEFSFDEVSKGERSLVLEGAIFYWNIGYYDDPTGQRRRVSEIRFRRLPAWHAADLRNAAREAERILIDLGIG